MRTAKFVARKQWIVCGSDDMFIRVYNYNTMDKVKAFEAHTDYIRCLPIRHVSPPSLSCSCTTAFYPHVTCASPHHTHSTLFLAYPLGAFVSAQLCLEGPCDVSSRHMRRLVALLVSAPASGG